jgi:hypothetical protein
MVFKNNAMIDKECVMKRIDKTGIFCKGLPCNNLSDFEAQLAEWVNAFKKKLSAFDLPYVLLRIVDSTFLIAFGYPEGQRHGVNNTGSYDDQIAIKNAVNNGEVIIIQNANDDPDCSYMKKHIQHKNINSIAYIPIAVGCDVRWIIVFDKADKQFGFSDDEIEKMQNFKIEVDMRIAKFKGKFLFAKQNDFEIVLDMFAHEIGNPLMTAGGFARRLEDLSAKGEFVPAEKIKKASAVIKTEVDRAKTKLYEIMQSLRDMLLEDAQDKHERETSGVSIDWIVSNLCEGGDWSLPLDMCVAISKRKAHILFSRVKSFISMNANGTPAEFNARKNGVGVMFEFSSSAFKPFKLEKDPNVVLFSIIANQCGGSLKIGQNSLVVKLPIVTPSTS